MFGLCILCLQKNILSNEHIFPEAAGGNISEHILCKPCNDKLGRFVDAPYLNQKHIQLARATYKISGKTGKTPQPFSDTYSVDSTDSQLKIKLDSDFRPRVVPQAPKVWITETGEIGISLCRDIKDKEEIPKIINKSIRRFFSSGEGSQLGWSEVKIENAIQQCIIGASNTQPISQKIQADIGGKWEINTKEIFCEHVKVIYEICCIELGDSFINSASGGKLRTFLVAQCQEKPEPWQLIDVAKQLNVAPQTPADLNAFINFATDNSPHTHHIAIVTPNGAFCSMLGMGATFHASNKNQESTPNMVKVYLVGINGGISGVFRLDEFLNSQRMAD